MREAFNIQYNIFPNRPEPTQWITYSKRPKSCNGIKGDFVTWTRLGLEGRVENKKSSRLVDKTGSDDATRTNRGIAPASRT